jgi:hypothetical protein
MKKQRKNINSYIIYEKVSWAWVWYRNLLVFVYFLNTFHKPQWPTIKVKHLTDNYG